MWAIPNTGRNLFRAFEFFNYIADGEPWKKKNYTADYGFNGPGIGFFFALHNWSRPGHRLFQTTAYENGSGMKHCNHLWLACETWSVVLRAGTWPVGVGDSE